MAAAPARPAAGPGPRPGRGAARARWRSAASGRARTTRSAVDGSRCSSCRTTARSRRVTRWRTTELPTALPTTKPARAPGGASSLVPGHRTRTRPRLLGPFGEVVEHHGRPPGAPAGPDDRGELRTPAQACLRGQHVRRRASRDPCADGRRGSPGPRGYASAAGSRGSSTVGGCSAGTCACSRGTPTTRHRRCAPTGGRVRAGRPGRTATCRVPATPEAGHCGAEHPALHLHDRAARVGGRSVPSTDSRQHNRETAAPEGRADPDR